MYEATIIPNHRSANHKKKQLLIKRNINVIPYNFHFYFLSYFYAAVPKGKNSIHMFVNYRFIGCPSRYERRRTYHCNRIQTQFYGSKVACRFIIHMVRIFKMPLLNMPTKLKAMPCNGREWVGLIPIYPAAHSISLYLALLKGAEFYPHCFPDLYQNKKSTNRLCRTT